MSNVEEFKEKIFDEVKHIDVFGNEYWYARELMPIFEYNKWENFHKVIKKAMIACEASENEVVDHFPEVKKMVNIGSSATRKTIDYKLSRYACYLIVQNADPNKKSIALGQTYFALQTRKMELTEKGYEELTEDEKRLYRRRQTINGNKVLYEVAKDKGVKNFDRFTNAGYRGLYNGESANDITKRKGLRYREEILDNMGSAELGANVFRITQTEELLKRQKEKNEDIATDTHYIVGATIREAIKKLGGTMLKIYRLPINQLKKLIMMKWTSLLTKRLIK